MLFISIYASNLTMTQQIRQEIEEFKSYVNYELNLAEALTTIGNEIRDMDQTIGKIIKRRRVNQQPQESSFLKSFKNFFARNKGVKDHPNHQQHHSFLQSIKNTFSKKDVTQGTASN